MKILFFASGSGSNIQNIVEKFRENNIDLTYQIITNRQDAGIWERAKNLNIPIQHFTKSEMQGQEFEAFIDQYEPDLIVLAGFLLLFPAHIIAKYPNKIINIHPALLPHYGGKGMYGMNVHKTVLQNKESISGITIHFVNEAYDDGQIILQKGVDIRDCKTANEIAQKIHELEYTYFPQVIADLLALPFSQP